MDVGFITVNAAWSFLMIFRSNGNALTGVPDDQEDSLLIRRCNDGDKSAWDEFYSRYRPHVKFAVSKFVRSDSNDIEDVIQEAFIQLFRALPSYDHDRKPVAFIFEIARNVAVSYVRRSTAEKRGGNPGGYVNVNDFEPVSTRVDQETELLRREEVLLLKKAVAKITEQCRQLLLLRYEAYLSYQEISRRLGIKEATLRVQAQRCLAALGRIYAGETPAEEGST
jgi:RNA polymerase sigma-70 factor, ECF subfamily